MISRVEKGGVLVRNPFSNRWEYWKPERPQEPGHQLILPERPEGTLVDNHPTKRVNITKFGLFYTLPMKLLSTIYDWITSLKYNDKHMAITNWIKSPKNHVLCKLAYTHLKPYHNFGPISFYSTNKYEWIHIHYGKNRSRFRPNTHLTKNNPDWSD